MQSVEANLSGGSCGADRLRPHEFFVIRYVPDIVRGEFLNIGIVVREVQTEGTGGPPHSAVRITRDWDRVKRLFLDADLELIKDMEDEFERWLQGVATNGNDLISEFDRQLDQLSLTVQLTDPRPCLAANVITQLTLLMRMYVDATYTPLPLGQTRVLSDFVRDWAREDPNGAFSAHKRAEAYTGHGDPLVFDCLWKSQHATHIIHALSIEVGVDQALALANRMDSLKLGVLAVEGKQLDMTVVVDLPPEPTPESFDAKQTYDFALQAMREAGIRVITVAALPTLAQEIMRAIRQGE